MLPEILSVERGLTDKRPADRAQRCLRAQGTGNARPVMEHVEHVKGTEKDPRAWSAVKDGQGVERAVALR